MSALPTAKIEMAFGAGFSTAATSRTWTDVTAYVIGSAPQSITRGRTDELTQPQPSTMTLTLLNKDGRFTPAYTSGAYYPNIVKGVPVRYSVVYNAVTYVRFTGYVAEWPVVWPDGSDVDSTVTITATSRLARLGQSAPLPSAIRAAYLATSPYAYWPMDEEPGVLLDTSGLQLFANVANTVVGDARAQRAIGSFWTQPSWAAVLRDGTPGPEDEQSLVRFVDTVTAVGYGHYAGSGNTVVLPVAGGLTFEAVARVSAPTPGAAATAMILELQTADLSCDIAMSTIVVASTGVAELFMGLNYATAAAPTVSLESPLATYVAPVVDGQIHHYLFTVDPTGTTVNFYFDGTLAASLALASHAFTEDFTFPALGDSVTGCTAWIGHAAVHTRALTPTEIATRAAAATAASATVGQRMTRLAGYLGVPSAEVSAEATVAQPLGPQSELGRTATDVLNELAASTGGVLFDARDGTLTMQARNHRYNAVSAFTLGTSGQEIEADFTSTLDDRYLVNTVNVTRVGGNQTTPVPFTDATSIGQYGVYASSMQIVSTSDDEAEAYARDALVRYAQPKVRVNQVTVDLVDLSTAQRALALNAEIGTLFTLTGLPVQAPGSSMTLFIEGYTEAISNAGHTITFNTTPGSSNPAWILGDATLGVLDSTTAVVY